MAVNRLLITLNTSRIIANQHYNIRNKDEITKKVMEDHVSLNSPFMNEKLYNKRQQLEKRTLEKR